MQLSDLISRLRTVLADPLATCFSDSVLEEAIRQALQEVDNRMPQVIQMDKTVTVSGRDQALDGLIDPLYLVSIRFADDEDELEPGLHFTYQLSNGVLMAHFTGSRVPEVGEILKINYASRHTVGGLDGAASTSLTDGMLSALVNGAEGHACVLRTHALQGASGVKSSEVGELLTIAQIRLDQFQKNLADLKIYQEFGFPQGFRLDRWDNRHEVV